jgi:uncharacterized protein
MKTNLFWKAKQYPSLENCIVEQVDSGWTISSIITGIEESKIFRVEYQVLVDQAWHTEAVSIKTEINAAPETFRYRSDRRGNWQFNGRSDDLFKGCIDVDLPLTPFTNTLPINRLKLKDNESQVIRVLYVDLINQEIKPLTQKYTRLSALSYKYENVPNDFEAIVTVDECGFVVDYPGLFERIAIRKYGNNPGMQSDL